MFGDGSDGVSYLQSDAAAQTTGYTGTLAVTDRYNKTARVDLAVVVENSRAGTLMVNEYWSGSFEIRGWVIVPEGKRLLMNGVNVTVKAGVADGIMEGGILVEAGGELVICGSASGERSVMRAFMKGVYWKGMMIGGVLSGTGFEITGAERALTVKASGSAQLADFILEENLMGIHLTGGTLDAVDGVIGGNEEYGIKEDGAGAYAVNDCIFRDNGVNYYKHKVSGLTMEEINMSGGNSGNKEEKR